MTHRSEWSRRRFLSTVAASALAPIACFSHPSEPEIGGGSARLTTRPGTPTATITPGLWPLELGPTTYDGFLLVPASYVAGTAMPLVLALHGAGSRAAAPIELLRPYAESRGFLVVSVDSVGLTWDAITSKYQSDVLFIDRALTHAFERCSVDAARIVVEGFSDGASYALGLGLANGDLFRRTVAFSPGGVPRSDSPDIGKTEFFISHGRQDPILHIDQASRILVPQLRGVGYTVEYVEFDGGHLVPAEIAARAADWLVRRGSRLRLDDDRGSKAAVGLALQCHRPHLPRPDDDRAGVGDQVGRTRPDESNLQRARIEIHERAVGRDSSVERELARSAAQRRAGGSDIYVERDGCRGLG